MTDVQLAVSVRDALDELDADTRRRVVEKLRDASANPEHYLKPLRGDEGYRLRIGDYRAIIDWDQSADVLYVIDFGHRRSIYD